MPRARPRAATPIAIAAMVITACASPRRDSADGAPGAPEAPPALPDRPDSAAPDLNFADAVAGPARDAPVDAHPQEAMAPADAIAACEGEVCGDRCVFHPSACFFSYALPAPCEYGGFCQDEASLCRAPARARRVFQAARDLASLRAACDTLVPLARDDLCNSPDARQRKTRGDSVWFSYTLLLYGPFGRQAIPIEDVPCP